MAKAPVELRHREAAAEQNVSMWLLNFLKEKKDLQGRNSPCQQPFVAKESEH